MELDPDVELVFDDPEQADRMGGLIAFSGTEPMTFFPVGNTYSAVENPSWTVRPTYPSCSVTPES